MLISLALILFSAVAYLGYSILQKDKQEEIIWKQISKLPDFTLSDVEGNSHSLKKLAENKATLLVYFNSTCEICQMEMNTISNRVMEFESYRLIFVTVESPEEITGFITELQMESRKNVHFLVDSEMEVAGYYGVKGVPALFIYDSTGNLVDSYTGPVKVDLILDKLKEGKESAL